MKTFLCALLALLTGLILGGWGPKSDLRRASAEIEQLKKQIRSRTSHAGLDGITSMLRIPEGGAAAKPGRDKSAPVTVTLSTSSNAAAASTPPPRQPQHHRFHGEDGEDSPQPDRKTLQERIQTASDLWKVRADLARSAFVANVTTSTVQASQFNLAVADMNLRLGTAIRDWVDTIQEQPEFTPETGIRMMSALSGELVLTYDQLDADMPPDWRQRAGDKFQVFDLIDPQVALPLTQIEGKMSLRPPAGPGNN
jgi:hypothetical protein